MSQQILGFLEIYLTQVKKTDSSWVKHQPYLDACDGADYLVDWTLHLRERHEELLVGVNDDIVGVLVHPAEDEIGPLEGLGEDGNQLLLWVNEFVQLSVNLNYKVTMVVRD